MMSAALALGGLPTTTTNHQPPKSSPTRESVGDGSSSILLIQPASRGDVSHGRLSHICLLCRDQHLSCHALIALQPPSTAALVAVVAMMSSAGVLRFVLSASTLCFAAMAVWSASDIDKRVPVSGGSALSRHPLSTQYSDLPFRQPLPVVLLSTVVHWLLFHLVPLPAVWRRSSPSNSVSVVSGVVQRNAVVSTLHAVVAVTGVLLWLSVFDVDWRSIQRGMGGGRRGTGDEWHSLAVGWSLGYFVYDTTCMLHYAQLWNVGALLHHCGIGAAFLLGLCTDCCRPFHFLFLLEELSTPPLNLKTLWRHNRRLSDVCAALFALLFVTVRLGYGTVVYVLACMQLVPFVRQAAEDGEKVQYMAALFQFVMCTASRLLNLYWTALIMKKLSRAMGGAAGSVTERLRGEVDKEGNALTSSEGGGDKVD